MKRILFVMMIGWLGCAFAMAQPQARRQQKTQKSNRDNTSLRAQISFPVQSEVSEDVIWRRDVYRELDLTESQNAALYYPVEPENGRVNLFTLLFKLIMAGPNHGGIAAYSYDVNTGNERFDESLRIKPLKFLDDYHIYYERTDRGIHIGDSDIPSAEVKAYFIKESSYYDQSTGTFHTKVLALCPVMMREDDFGDGVTKYPLFWVRYSDIAPYLAKQIVMTSDINNAATMSLDDYFTMNAYKGKIYKTTNMLGQTLVQEVGNDSVRLSDKQKAIDREIATFEKNIWGDQARKDSIDSISKTDRKAVKAEKKAAKRKNSSVRSRRSKSDSGSSSAAPRVTVRRERH